MFAKTTFIAGASQGPYAIAFPFLASSHVLATVNGVAATITVSTSTFVFVTPTLAGGETCVVYRETERATAIVNFQAGGVLKEADLDKAVLQNLYITQELQDTGSGTSGLPLGGSGHWDAQSLRITNVANGSAAQDSCTKGQLDAAVIAAGGLPAVNGGDNGDSLFVVAGAWAKTLPAAARTALGLGTSAVVNAGTGASEMVQLTAASKLPAVDGSLLTNLPSTATAFAMAYVRLGGTAIVQNASGGAWYQDGAGVTCRINIASLDPFNNGGGDIAINDPFNIITLQPGTYDIMWFIQVSTEGGADVATSFDWAFAKADGSAIAYLTDQVQVATMGIHTHTLAAHTHLENCASSGGVVASAGPSVTSTGSAGLKTRTSLCNGRVLTFAVPTDIAFYARDTVLAVNSKLIDGASNFIKIQRLA